MATKNWWLFIDESGAFDSLNRQVVVAGLLVEAGAPHLNELSLNKLLQDQAPHVPRPLHAAHLNIPVMHALWLAQKDYRHPYELEAEASREAMTAMKKHMKAELGEANEHLSRSRLVPIKLVKALDDWLMTGRPRDYELMEQLKVRVRDDLARAMKTLAEIWTAEQQVVLVASSETMLADAAGVPPWNDRYLELLETVMERVHLALERVGGQHKVFLRVLTRLVRDPFLGTPAPLHLRHLRNLAERVHKSARQGVLFDAVSFEPLDAPRFESSIHPGLVLADLVANRMLPLVGPRRTLEYIEKQVRSRFFIPLSFESNERRPMLSASGEARRLVAAARAGRAEEVERSGYRLWAVEQALRWVEELHSSTGVSA